MEILDKIISYTQDLVKIPSYENEKEIAMEVYDRLLGMGQRPEIISSNINHPSVICYVSKPNAKKIIMLEAPLDTVPPGELLSWKVNPLIPTISNGKMYGLGVADSKIAIALYSHLASDLYSDPEFESSIFLAFDAQEQSGHFGGIKDILSYIPEVDAAILGYQSYNELHIGARGWLRIKITTYGEAAHTGSRYTRGVNAITQMSYIISHLQEIEFKKSGGLFNFGSKLTISMIKGGQAINIVPDKCEIYLDIRFTPDYLVEEVLELITSKVEEIKSKQTEINYNCEILQSENAYQTSQDDKLVQLLQKNYREVVGNEIPLTVSGQGSVGNLLNGELGIPVINAFGVANVGVHSPSEEVDLNTLPDVYRILRKTLIEYSKS